MAEEGRKLSPNVNWHIDDACLSQSYDMVMFSGSLQVLENWDFLLRRATSAVRSYLFLLSQVSTVERVPSYVAVQRHRGVTMLHQQLKRARFLAIVQNTGLRLVGEFAMGEHPRIVNAPEQPSIRGWLFQRASAESAYLKWESAVAEHQA